MTAIESLSLPDVKLITPRRFGDDRGHFSETFKARELAGFGVEGPWVQDNLSVSRARGTIRGLHCQLAPSAQGKLVRCARGAIWDVAVDIRTGSATYGRYAAATLSAENGAQLWVPAGFLHGFCTLEDDTEVNYKVTAYYDPATERGVIWNDPALALPWPLDGADPALSAKDAKLPGFDEARGWFAA